MALPRSAPYLMFDIDHFLNPFIPRSHLNRLPTALSHFLGHRTKSDKDPPVPVQWLFTFLATIAGLCLVSTTYLYGPGLAKYHPPVIIASLGASAVLDFNAIRSPLAQPRNAVVGHALSALVGVAIAKLFFLSTTMQSYPWVSGAVACACASIVMSLTNTVHPPGGATAVLASVDATIVALGWMFVPFILVGSLLMVAIALLANNIARRYPVYWWTAAEVGGRLPWYNHRISSGGSEATDVNSQDVEAQKDMDNDSNSVNSMHRSFSHSSTSTLGHEALQKSLYVSASELHVPEYLQLSEDEFMFLHMLQAKISERRSECEQN